jgi:hypothetical protein
MPMRTAVAKMNETLDNYKFIAPGRSIFENKYFRRIDDITRQQRAEIKQNHNRQKRRRKKESKAPRINDPLSRFIVAVLRLKQKLQKCWNLRPLEEHSPEQIKSFVDDTQWLIDEHERAKRLL